jgi:ligand-binding sensor domain-containing protein
MVDTMRTQSLCLVLAVVLLSCFASAQWVSTNGPYDGVITSFAVVGTNLFAGTSNGNVFLSKDEGASWAELDTGLTGSYVYCLAVSGENLFAGTDSGVFHSKTSGTIWSSANSGLTSGNIYALAVSSPCSETDPTYLFAGTDSGVFLSTNNGTSWTAVNNGLSYLSAIALAVSNHNLVAGTSGGGLFLSTTNGANWIPSTMHGSVVVHSLATNENNVFAGISWSLPFVSSYAGVFLSTDGGANWTNRFAYGGIEGGGLIVSDFAASGTTLFAATIWSSFGNPTYQGVYLSTDSGRSWSGVNTGLVDSSVFALAVNGNSLFAGTSEAGVWRRPLSEMITSVENWSSELPREFRLLQNYPNPFNPSTNIKYELQRSSEVRLTVYDMLGREVSVLVNEKKDAGVHEVKFDGTGLSSGVYFYRLTAGSFTQTRKLVLMK